MPEHQAILDNEETQTREAWLDGRRVAGITRGLLSDGDAMRELRRAKTEGLLVAMADLGSWRPWRLVGSRLAVRWDELPAGAAREATAAISRFLSEQSWKGG
jgi:hypothetical protein